MKRLILPFGALTVTFALALPAQAALLTRTFVSSAGNDSNPCTVTAPCATFAHASMLTATDGIVAALDPGKYGPLTITGGITINGNGWSAITAPAQGNGITVSAGSGNVTLTGLEIDGAHTGYNGIALNSAGSLTVTKCVLQNFFRNTTGSTVQSPLVNNPNTSGYGILLQPIATIANITITDTTASNNDFNGIGYYAPSNSPSANIVIDHVAATANTNGIYFISNGGAVIASISNSVASNNGATGIGAAGTTKMLLGRSVITGNSVGINNATSSSTFYSLQDNQIGLNSTDVTGGLDTMTYPPR